MSEPWTPRQTATRPHKYIVDAGSAVDQLPCTQGSSRISDQPELERGLGSADRCRARPSREVCLPDAYGFCSPDRDAKAKSIYMPNGGSEEGWKRILTLVDRVRSALASKDVAFLVR